MSRYKYFWDLANSKAYTTHIVDQFDENSSTGGGVFKWIYANNTTITEIAGFRIKPTSTITGYWERETNGEAFNVAWFGTINTSNQLRAVTYGITDAILTQRYGVDGYIGSGMTLTDTYDTIAIKYALYCMKTFSGFQTLNFESKDYYITSTVYLPGLFNLSTDRILYKIKGNNARINTYSVNIDNFTFFSSQMPISVSEATSLKVRSFNISDFKLIGNPPAYVGINDCGILLGETDNSVISNVHTESFYYGIHIRNCSNTQFHNNSMKEIETACIKITYGSSYSGTVGNSYSNNINVSNNYLHTSTGADASIVIEATPRVSISENIIDGDVAGLGTNAIHFDNLSSTNVSECTIKNNVIKRVTDSGDAYIYIRSRTGIYNIDNITIDNSGLLVESIAQTGNPEIKIQNVSFMPSGTTLKSDTNSRWIITDNKLPTALAVTSETNLRTNVDGSSKTFWYSGCNSVTSVTIGTGAQSFTIPINMPGYTAGNAIKIEYTADSAQYMVGTVTSYNSGTGALVVDVTSVAGAGTYTDWTIYTQYSTPPATNIVYRGSNGQGG